MRECIFTTPNLERGEENWTKPSGLVKMSASWREDETCKVLSKLAWILSQMKWQSTLICFFLSWNTRLAAIWRAAWLSQKSTEAVGCGMQRSWSKAKSQVSPQVATAIALYSAEERETTVCFFDLHDIKESPKKKQNPIMDLRVSGQLDQSESQKPFNCKVVSERDNKP